MTRDLEGAESGSQGDTVRKSRNFHNGSTSGKEGEGADFLGDVEALIQRGKTHIISATPTIILEEIMGASKEGNQYGNVPFFPSEDGVNSRILFGGSKQGKN